MSRNLIGISTIDIVRVAVMSLSTVVFVAALVIDSFILWTLSFICLMVFFRIHGQSRQGPGAKDVFAPPFIDPGSCNSTPMVDNKGPVDLARRRDSPLAGRAAPSAQPPRSGNYPAPRTAHVKPLQLVLFDSPPICLN